LKKFSRETNLNFDLRKAKKNRESDKSVLEGLSKFSATLDDKNIGAILNRSKAADKASKISTTIEK